MHEMELGRPEVGDIWEAQGHEYFVRASHDDRAVIAPFELRRGLFIYSGETIADFMALNPVLRRRRKGN